MGRRKKLYLATKGAQFDKSRVQEFGEALEQIQRTHGLVKPEQVVEYAADPDNPLHDCFEWDDTEAATRWRIHQARNLINHIEIDLQAPDGYDSAPAFVNVTLVGEEPVRGYIDIETATMDPGLRDQVISAALTEAERWMKRYQKYTELEEIFEVIHKHREKLRKKRAKARAKSKSK
jgi:hypothetical protein